eukprot:COSAG01_NODE_47356_length_391_cov_0.708904_1_plen_76_part_01
MVGDGALAALAHGVLEELADDGVRLVHVWDVEAAAPIHLQVQPTGAGEWRMCSGSQGAEGTTEEEGCRRPAWTTAP